jgi:hypothetical protein
VNAAAQRFWGDGKECQSGDKRRDESVHGRADWVSSRPRGSLPRRRAVKSCFHGKNGARHTTGQAEYPGPVVPGCAEKSISVHSTSTSTRLHYQPSALSSQPSPLSTPALSP